MNEFGPLLKQLRLSHRVTLRGIASKAGVSSTYISELERGVKVAPSKEVLDKIVKAMNLDRDEASQLYQMAGKTQNTIAYDLPEYIMNRDYVAAALRVARDVGAGKEIWDKFVEELYANENSKEV